MLKALVILCALVTYLNSPVAAALEIVAKVIKTQGVVEIQDANGKRTNKVVAGSVLSKNQILNTSANGVVAIRTSTGDTVVLNSTSAIKASPEKNTIEHLGGKVLYLFTPNKTIDRNVRLHTATMGIRGTTFLVDSDQNQATSVALIEGQLEVNSLQAGFNVYQQKTADDFDAYKRQIEEGVAAEQKEFDQYTTKTEEEFVAFQKSITLEKQQSLSLKDDKAVIGAINAQMAQSVAELQKFIAK